MQTAPQVVVALLLASRVVLCDATTVNGTEMATSTVAPSTETSVASTLASTASSSTTGTMTETHSITASSNTATVVTTGTRSSTATSNTDTSGTITTETHSVTATSNTDTSGTVTTETHSITTTSNTDSFSTVTSMASTSMSTSTPVIGQTSTETSSGTLAPNMETSTSTWDIIVLCLGDAETFEAGHGNCSSYAPGDALYVYYIPNYYYCDLDEDRDGLIARQVCPECGLCTVGTSTTSAHTTTGTSSETSTTSPHTTTDTSSSTTPHTTTETDTATHTQSACDRAFEALWLAISREAACELVNDTCPAACAAAPLEHTIVACDGTDGAFGAAEGAEAGFLAIEVLGYAEGACQEVVVDAVLGSTAYELSCLNRLALLHAPIHACSGHYNVSACPEVCERVMDSAFGRCFATDTFLLHSANYTAAELVGPLGPAWSPQCLAALGTKTFLGAGATSTDEPASTTGHHGTGPVGGSSMATSSSGTTMGESSSVTSSSVADEEEPSSLSHQSGVGLRALLLAGLLALI